MNALGVLDFFYEGLGQMQSTVLPIAGEFPKPTLLDLVVCIIQRCRCAAVVVLLLHQKKNVTT